MRRSPLLVPVFAFAAALLATTPLRAQTVDPGMSREQVIERLGRPMGERSTGPRTFLFYRNGCERRCGMHDLVVLENDAVVDAIFRAEGRRYSGESSSPRPVPPRRASVQRAAAPAPPAAPAARTPARAPARRRTQVALPPGSARGGIVIGDTPTPPAGAPRSVRGAAGAPADSGTAADAARPRRQPGGDVRVPIVPRDTQVGVPPRERGKRTLPGPVIVPTTPRDSQVGRPDSGGARRQPAPRQSAPRRPAPARPDSSTATRPPR